ncbi:MAG: hypothetical protein ABSD98_19015 [Candidatus Korobacteraceae bacterium]|jgi:hypothetical protein
MKSRRHSLYALAILALAITPSLVFGQNNTGTAGTCPPCDVLDPYYTLVIVPPPLIAPLPVYSAPPVPGFPGWVLPVPGSNWINADGYDNSNGLAGLYDYQTMFAFGLPVNTEGEFAADNSGCLYANGVVPANKIGCTPLITGFAQYTHFVIPKSDLVAGTNTLDFQVTNTSSSWGGSWTGLEAAFFCPPSLGPVSNPTLGLYSDGGASAWVDAWTINNGYIVSDTFGIASSGLTVTGFCFFAWVSPLTDVPNTVDWSITSQENGGTYYGDGTAPLTCALYCTAGQIIGPPQFPPPPGRNCGLGLADVYACTALGLNVPLFAGTFWFNLQNATTTPGGGVVYWDQNSGVGCAGPQCPSSASENTVGIIPAESFVLYGQP